MDYDDANLEEELITIQHQLTNERINRETTTQYIADLKENIEAASMLLEEAKEQLKTAPNNDAIWDRMKCEYIIKDSKPRLRALERALLLGANREEMWQQRMAEFPMDRLKKQRKLRALRQTVGHAPPGAHVHVGPKVNGHAAKEVDGDGKVMRIVRFGPAQSSRPLATPAPLPPEKQK